MLLFPHLPINDVLILTLGIRVGHITRKLGAIAKVRKVLQQRIVLDHTQLLHTAQTSRNPISTVHSSVQPTTTWHLMLVHP